MASPVMSNGFSKASQQDDEEAMRSPLSQGTLSSDDSVEVVGTTSTRMTKQQKLIVATFCFSNFGIGLFYSLLGPFFPNEAAAKGVSSTVTGLVFGVYELVFVIASPLLGAYITKIGPKFMFEAGMMSFGYCAIIFGFLDWSPPGTTYAVLCFTVRLFEGVGAAAVMTSSFAILAHTFPEKVATMLGSLEMFNGLGLMAGPPLGGLLYQLGGFRLPFFVSGGVLILLGILFLFTLPKSEEPEEKKSDKSTLVTMLSTPLVLFSCLLCLCTSICIGFYDVGLAPVLSKQFGLSPLLTGVVFLAGTGTYTIIAPIWGMVADKFPRQSIWVLIIGFIVGGFSYWLLGPAPFLHLGEFKLWMVIVSQLLMAIGIGTSVVLFQLLTTAAKDNGLPDTLETYGIISGIFTSAFSLGAFIGPVAGGALIDNVGFAWASVAIGSVTVASALVTLFYMCVAMLCKKDQAQRTEASEQTESSVTERTPLLREA